MGLSRQKYWSGVPLPSPQDLLELTPKMMSFHHQGRECKSRKSEDTWSNKQVWPWSTKWSRAKANIILPREHICLANTLFQQHRRRLYTWTSISGQYWNQIDHILCSRRRKSCIRSAETRPGTDCGSDHQLLIEKFRIKLKKVGKTTKPVRYDLKSNRYEYIVDVMNRFKGLYIVNRMPEELWTEISNTVQGAV